MKRFYNMNSYFVAIDASKDLLEIKAIKGERAYSILKSKTQLLEYKIGSSLNDDKYLEKTISAFTENGGNTGFQCEDIDTGVQVIWFLETGGNIRMNLGCMKLEPDYLFSKETMIEQLINLNSQMQTEIAQISQQHVQRTRERDECLQKYEELVKQKEADDSMLFKNFKLVINEKKHKIKQLEEELSNLNKD